MRSSSPSDGAWRGATASRLRLALEQPFGVEIEGVVNVSFTNDALTPITPGFDVRLNGQPTVARTLLDASD